MSLFVSAFARAALLFLSYVIHSGYFPKEVHMHVRRHAMEDFSSSDEELHEVGLMFVVQWSPGDHKTWNTSVRHFFLGDLYSLFSVNCVSSLPMYHVCVRD